MLSRCRICHALTTEKDSLCHVCRESIERDSLDSYMTRCPVCLYPLVGKDYVCTNCLEEGFLSVYSVSDYKAVFSRQILERFKFYFDKKLSRIIAGIFFEAVSKCSIDVTNAVLVPVPCSKRSLHKRGWDHMVQVCRQIRRLYKIPYLCPIANVQKTKVQQKELSKDQRREQSENKYRLDQRQIKHLKRYGTVILIDDVITTGSTLRQCRNLLVGAGISSIKIITWFTEL